MIRVTLRQFRLEATIAFGLLGALAMVLLATGVHLADVNDVFLKSCHAAGDCTSVQNPVVNVYPLMQNALPLVVTVVPALLGIFFGAPLIARELETGTFRLAWTQSVSRQRWLAVKLGIVGLAAVAIGGLLALLYSWWASPIDAAQANRFTPANFGIHGVAPIGYAAFAFALGATAGVLLRRTVAAMAVTIAGFIVTRLVVGQWLRPHYWTPLHASLPLRGGLNISLSPSNGVVSVAAPQVDIPNAWVLSTELANKAGQQPSAALVDRLCSGLSQLVPGGGQSAHGSFGAVRQAIPATARNAMQSCTANLSRTFHVLTTYQPGSRFWPFQLVEMGIFLVAAAALCGLTFAWLRRRYA